MLKVKSKSIIILTLSLFFMPYVSNANGAENFYRFLEENAQLTAEVQILRDENLSLKRSGVIKWLLAGGGVFFFGWIIGKISRKRKQGLAI